MLPLSFGNNKEYNRKDYNDRFYGFLPKEDIDHYSFIRAMILKHPLIIRIVKRFVRKKHNNIKENASNYEYNVGEPSIIKIWKKEFSLDNLENPLQKEQHKNAFEEKIQILQDGLEFCHKHQWKPILVVPPIPEVTRKYISDDFLEEFVYRNIDALKKQNSQLQVLDYFKMDYPDDYYKNDIFMNEKGQKMFSVKLFKDIDELKL